MMGKGKRLAQIGALSSLVLSLGCTVAQVRKGGKFLAREGGKNILAKQLGPDYADETNVTIINEGGQQGGQAQGYSVPISIRFFTGIDINGNGRIDPEEISESGHFYSGDTLVTLLEKDGQDTFEKLVDPNGKIIVPYKTDGDNISSLNNYSLETRGRHIYRVFKGNQTLNRVINVE